MELSVCWFDKVQNNGFFMLWQMWQIKQLWQVQNAQKTENVKIRQTGRQNSFGEYSPYLPCPDQILTKLATFAKCIF